ncbi:hypothetical protein [Ferribacterium limneticum]|uniref:hypothetical protein n=1 Tax=Ferribacterium limneticum TaxID=76259 RepID=UPI001CF88B02|nr:hypothetical protein [Ferribacterium limneticum]UCV22178.1 hypothetical protein KI613_16870 [Ferribacterium limneticum]
MKHRAPPSAQRGVALLALLVMLLLAGGYAFYRNANIGSGQTQERDSVLQRLAQAKETVIAYAVNDATRPGRLLCPDIIGDGRSPTFTQDDCASYGGWLPWSTLNLAENTDAQGGKFRYYLSPAFGGKSVNKKVNSDTPTSLHLDVPAGSASNDIAAVIIATRGALDTANADGDDYFYNGASNSPEDNDIVIAVTRQELMTAVEQRIANELRTCLEQHATNASNLQHTYPWPAPLSNNIFKGATKSLFGMVPDTQAGNPEMALKDTITKLTATKNSLNSASTAADQLAAVYQLQEQAAYARALFDRQYQAAVDLSDKATKSKADFTALDASIVTATKTAGAFAAFGNTLPGAIASALPSLTALNDSLANNGFDLFLMELQLNNPDLKASIDIATGAPTKANFGKLITPVNLFKNSLLEYSGTINTDIDGKISAAHTSATNAAVAVNLAKNYPSAPIAEPIAQQALTEATNLYNANRLVETTVLATRVNVDADEVSFRATSIGTVLATSNSEALVGTLESSKTLVTSIATGSTAVIAARSATLSALENALAAAKTGADQTLIRTNAETAATQLNALATALDANGDNVALETLKSVAIALTGAQQTPPANVTTARTLRTPAKTVIYWSDTAIAQAADLARLAKKGISSQEDSDSSAYTAARKLLDSLDGSNGTITRLDSYNKNATDEGATLARDAFNKTLGLLNDLLSAAARLDASLETSMAEAAAPPTWYGNACLFLTPATGDETWWTANAWKNVFFYQIADRVRPPIGLLTVNGSGNYRAVAIAAGKALPNTQNRTLRETRSYLEKINADNSRNGDAQSPSPRFVTETVSPTFNDRLAY